MKKSKCFIHRVVLMSVLTLFISTAWMPVQNQCHKINAKGKGQTVSQTTGGATTVANLIGGGILHGTTRAEFVFTGPPDEQTGEIPFAGTLVLTTKHGTLTFNATGGVLNTAIGSFSTDLEVVEGSGKLSSATGSLFISGVTNLSTGNFTEDINGEICLN